MTVEKCGQADGRAVFVYYIIQQFEDSNDEKRLDLVLHTYWG
jgi:hypothetical protein